MALTMSAGGLATPVLLWHTTSAITTPNDTTHKPVLERRFCRLNQKQNDWSPVTVFFLRSAN